MILARTGVTLLIVKGLVSIRQQLMNVEQETVLVTGAKLAGIVVQLKQARVEGAVRAGCPDILAWLQVRGQQVNRSAEIRGTEIRGLARAAVKIRRANPLRGKIRPGMVRGTIGVLEGNAVKGHGVLTVLESAEIGLALPEADPVRIEAERTGRQIQNLGEIRDRRHEVPDELSADLRFGGCCVERVSGRRELRCHRSNRLNRDCLGHVLNAQGDGDIPGKLLPNTAGGGKSGRRCLDCICATGQVGGRKMTVRIGG